MTERDTLQIDAYREATGDRAVWNGHFYSDKAPGRVAPVAFVPVDVVRALNNARRHRSRLGRRHHAHVVRGHGRRVGRVHGRRGALRALALARMGLLARGGALCGDGVRRRHAGVVLRHALHGPRALRRLPDDRVHRGRRAARCAARTRASTLAWTIGLSAGWAVVSEFPAAVPVLFICGLALAVMSGTRPRRRRNAGGRDPRRRRRRDRRARSCSPTTPRRSARRFTWATRARKDSSSCTRGCSASRGPNCGACARSSSAAIAACCRSRRSWRSCRSAWSCSRRRRPRVAPAVAAAAIARLLPRAQRVVLLLGRRMGVRPAAGHARAAVSRARPGAALGPVEDGRARRCWPARWLWGAALTLVAVSTTPQPPAAIMRPVTELMMPAFREGHLALNTQRFTDFRADENAIWRHADPTVSWNLGMVMGLTGRASLVPLGARLARCGALWLICARPALTRRAGAPARRTTSSTGASRFCLIDAEERVGDQVVAGRRSDAGRRCRAATAGR